MPSLSQRIKAFLNPIPVASKSFTRYNLFDSSMGYQGANQDLRADEYGAAQAIVVMTEIQRAVKFWQQWLSGLTWHLYDGNSDKILTSSTDRQPPSGAGQLWFNSIKRFPEAWKHDFLESIAFSDWVYGETYIGKLKNTIQVADWMWLNPLAIEPELLQGRIIGYRYSGDEGYYLLTTDEVSYRIAQRNPLNDWRGLSPILTAIDKINVHENVYRSLNAHYRNNMQLGGIVSGKPNADGFSIEGTTVAQIEDEMRRNHKGVANAFSWFFSNAPIQVDQFQAVDIEKNYAIIQPLRKEIAMALGIPPVLSGDPTEVNYDNADKVMKNWWQTDGIPYARKVAGFINRQLLPAIEPGTDIYFGFDFTAFEIEPPETVSTDFTSQIIPINIAQQKRGYEVDEKLKDIYIIGGRPMHRDLIIQEALAGLQSAQDTDTTSQTDSKVAIPQAEVFGYHIESGIVDINEARAQLGLPPKAGKETNELQELQAKLAVMVTASQAGIPAALAAQMVDLKLPDTLTQTTPQADSEPIADTPDETKHLHIEGHDLDIATWDYSPDNARKELIVWQRKADKPFTPEYTRGDIADMVQEALDNGEDIKGTFDKAFAMLPQGIDSLKTTFTAFLARLQSNTPESAVKTLQSIRLDFEGDFEDVLRAIRNGNIDNRRRAGNILRQIVRTFGFRAYRQGMLDGGVDADPDEDEQAEIAALRTSATSHISNLTRVLIREDGVTDAQAASKPEMWYRKTVLPFYYAGLESAARNVMMEFAGNDGAKSCSTCKRLKGQRHRLKDWKRKALRPQVDTSAFECGGWQCEHKLIPVSGKARGKW